MRTAISIWFFIGICLVVMGGLTCIAGVHEAISPPPLPQRVVLYHLHASIWWGALLLAIGAFYCIRFSPKRGSTHS